MQRAVTRCGEAARFGDAAGASAATRAAFPAAESESHWHAPPPVARDRRRLTTHPSCSACGAHARPSPHL